VTPVRIIIAAVVLVASSLGSGRTASSIWSGPERLPVSGPAYGTYAWPVNGPVIRGFEPPPDPYSAGHRGIDIATPFGSPMVAAQDGVVSFAGFVAGSLFISIDHSGGVRTTYSWLSAVGVKKGATVTRGQLIGSTGHGHPDVPTPHLHFGAKIGTTYIDPMLLLERASVVGLIRLAPIDQMAEGSAWPPTMTRLEPHRPSTARAPNPPLPAEAGPRPRGVARRDGLDAGRAGRMAAVVT
jgi:Peptidase family M23